MSASRARLGRVSFRSSGRVTARVSTSTGARAEIQESRSRSRAGGDILVGSSIESITVSFQSTSPARDPARRPAPLYQRLCAISVRRGFPSRSAAPVVDDGYWELRVLAHFLERADQSVVHDNFVYNAQLHPPTPLDRHLPLLDHVLDDQKPNKRAFPYNLPHRPSRRRAARSTGPCPSTAPQVMHGPTRRTLTA